MLENTLVISDNKTKDFENNELGEKKNKFQNVFILNLIGFFLPSIITFFILFTFIHPYQVMGTSMNPNFIEDETILTTKFYNIKRNDVVVIKSQKIKKNIVKRVIGLPNETVTIKGNDIYINGELIEDKYGYYDNDIYTMELLESNWKLDDDEYFVLGDNRQVSFDSRYGELGEIPKDEIIAKYYTKMPKFLDYFLRKLRKL